MDGRDEATRRPAAWPRLLPLAALLLATLGGLVAPGRIDGAHAVPQAAQRDDDEEETPTPRSRRRTPTPAPGAEAGTYESPQYGYALTYDPEEWEVFLEDEDPDDEYDQIFLSNGTSVVGLTGDPDYEEDELADCVDDYVAGLRQGERNADVEPLDERRAAGERRTRAWATFTYTYEFEDGDEGDFVRYYECRALGDAVTLVVLHDAPADAYEDEVDAREELLDGLETPEAEPTPTPGRRRTPTPEPTAEAEDLLADVETYDVDDISHTEADVDYDPVPPVGGPHHPVWQNCGVYDEPVIEEHAVHSLEHGAVWITYDPDLPASEVELLAELAEGETYVLVSPYPDLPAPVVASAWGAQLLLEDADDPRLAAFVEHYLENPTAPEPGAPCAGGTSETAD